MSRVELPLVAIFMLLLLTNAVHASQPSPELFLLTDFTGVYIEPGDRISTNIYLYMDAATSVLERVSLSYEAPEGWDVAFFYKGYRVYELLLTNDERRMVNLEISSPSGVKPGTYKIKVSAAGSTAQPATLEFTIIVLPKPAVAPIELRIPYVSLNGEPGSTLDYRFDLKNNMDRSVVVGFEAFNVPEGWEVSFKPSTFEDRIISSISLRPKQTEIGLVMSVRIPRNAVPGEYSIGLRATLGDYVTESNVSAIVTGIKTFTLSTANELLNLEVQAGEEKSITLLIANRGTESIESIDLSTLAPSGWRVEVDPDKISFLRPGSVATATLTIQPPPNALAGDYSVRVSSFSAEADTRSIELRVTVTKQTYWGLIGVAIVVASVMALLGVFWRFGRP